MTVELFDDYAVSVYADEISGTFYVREISFIKVDSCEEGASEVLYQYLEDDYYRVRESLEDEKWIISPDGTKEACASEGMLTKHPSQIFIRYREVSAPDLIFRIVWACKVVGWIDDQYLVCDMVDIGPVLINLENHEVEQIKTPTDDYDGYGAQYVIDGGFLIASCMEEEIYRWEIMVADGGGYQIEPMGEYCLLEK